MPPARAFKSIRSHSDRDGNLEAAFARRDAAAFDAAYARYGGRMYAAALRVLRDPEASRECVHDVLLHLWRRNAAYSPERGSLEAFLVVCSRNAALARARNDTRRRRIAATLPDEGAAYDLDPLEGDDLGGAIDKLPAAQAQAIRMAYYDDMTHVDIAARLNEPLGTVKSRLSAGLRGLRAMLASEES